MSLSADLREFIELLNSRCVEYVIVGGRLLLVSAALLTPNLSIVAAQPSSGVEIALVVNSPSADVSGKMIYTTGEQVLVKNQPEFREDDIAQITSHDEGGEGNLLLTVTPTAKQRLERFTADHINDRVAILANGKVLSAPTIRTPIRDGEIKVSGRFTTGEARHLAYFLSKTAQANKEAKTIAGRFSAILPHLQQVIVVLAGLVSITLIFLVYRAVRIRGLMLIGLATIFSLAVTISFYALAFSRSPQTTDTVAFGIWSLAAQIASAVLYIWGIVIICRTLRLESSHR